MTPPMADAEFYFAAMPDFELRQRRRRRSPFRHAAYEMPMVAMLMRPLLIDYYAD
jgi:hypothetical protein